MCKMNKNDNFPSFQRPLSHILTHISIAEVARYHKLILERLDNEPLLAAFGVDAGFNMQVGNEFCRPGEGVGIKNLGTATQYLHHFCIHTYCSTYQSNSKYSLSDFISTWAEAYFMILHAWLLHQRLVLEGSKAGISITCSTYHHSSDDGRLQTILV